MNTSLRHSFALFVLLFALGSAAQETAAQWADKNKDALAAINDSSLAVIVKQGSPAFAALFAEIKTAGASDPVASTRIAALTQYVMIPGRDASRKAYSDALLAAAQKSTEADVISFFLNQLRWCGLPQQAEAIKAFGKSDTSNVAAFAAMTVQAVTDDRASKAAPVTPTRYAAFNAELAALAPKALTPRLLQAFDDPDLAFAGTALAAARTAGGKAETALWTAKLARAADPVRKTMLLDMLAARGDKAASTAASALLADADDAVAAAAQHALIVLDPAGFAAQLPALLKSLPPARLTLARDGVRQLKTGLIKTPLTQAYSAFSDTGKKVALELIKERHIAEAASLGVSALDSKDEEAVIAGYRLLREIADKSQADLLVAKALATTGRVTPEAQSALAAAARRDTSGAFAAALAKALLSATEAQKPVALETAARLGGDALLKTVENATASANAEVSTAAVRALADWADAASAPALLRLAATAQGKQQALAQRGLAKKLNGDGADKKASFALWQSLKSSVTDEARKKAIDDLFKQETNAAFGKPVTANVPQEGGNAPANLTDGTLTKAWHGAKSPAQATIDLGSAQTLSAMHVTFYHDDGRTYTFTLELSEDNKTWRQVAGNTDAPKPATAEGLRVEFVPTPARYARLNVLKNSANQAVHVLELKLFANSL